jgi:hypothetical protein
LQSGKPAASGGPVALLDELDPVALEPVLLPLRLLLLPLLELGVGAP